jgi:hypothetical protein
MIPRGQINSPQKIIGSVNLRLLTVQIGLPPGGVVNLAEHQETVVGNAGL